MGEGHRKRMRDRYASKGIKDLTYEELVEMLLYYAIPRKDTRELALKITKRFSTIAELFDSSYEDLLKIEGITDNLMFFFRFLKDISILYRHETRDPDIFINYVLHAGYYLLEKYADLKNEVIIALFLDKNKQLISSEIIKEGDGFSVEIDINKIVQRVDELNSSYLILAHNHPSGLAIPSERDISVTESLKKIFDTLGIKFLDHIIFEKSDFISLAQSNIIFINI